MYSLRRYRPPPRGVAAPSIAPHRRAMGPARGASASGPSGVQSAARLLYAAGPPDPARPRPQRLVDRGLLQPPIRRGVIWSCSRNAPTSDASGCSRVRAHGAVFSRCKTNSKSARKLYAYESHVCRLAPRWRTSCSRRNASMCGASAVGPLFRAKPVADQCAPGEPSWPRISPPGKSPGPVLAGAT